MTEVTNVLLVTPRGVGHEGFVKPNGVVLTPEACNLDQSTYTAHAPTDSPPTLKRRCRRCFPVTA